jgi:hypothetical protein
MPLGVSKRDLHAEGVSMKKLYCITIFLALFPVLTYGQSDTLAKTGSPFSQAKFVPDISLILDCSYAFRNVNDERMRTLFIPELTHVHSDGDAEGHSREAMHAHKGFNLNYGEITFFSVVDPYFELFAVCHVSESSFGLEEAYWTTRKFPLGLQLKAGKFLSSFGRLNEQHAHYWDFADRPLIYSALLGEEGLNEIGARVTWVAPLEMFLLVGGELLEGKNEMSFGRTGFHDPLNSVSVADADAPNLRLMYLKSSVDIDDLTLLGGISAAWGRTRIDHSFSSGAADGHAISAQSNILGFDLTMKYPLDAIRYLSLQSEYLLRQIDGNRYGYADGGAIYTSSLKKRQSGFYVQFVGKLSLRWRAGIRCDAFHMNEISLNGVSMDAPGDLQRFTAMLEYNPTEFSRIRIQYNYDRSKYALGVGTLSREPIHEFIIQANLAIGAHGAHPF